MQKLSVTIPTGLSPRPVVARQTMQNALNRSIPAVSPDDEKPEQLLYKTSPAPHPHTVRAISSGISATNEFSTRTRVCQSRQPARTSVVDVGNIYVHPKGRVNVRGVHGFFPPLKIKGDGGSMRTRHSMSAPAGTSSISPRNSDQESPNMNHSATHKPTYSKALHVELAPSAAATSQDKTRETWPKPSNNVKNNQSPVRFQQNQYHDHQGDPSEIVDLAPQGPCSGSEQVPRRESVEDMRMTRDSGHVTALSNTSSSLTNKNRDAPFIRAYKLKQKRQHKIKEIMDSNYKSPTMEDLRVQTT